MPATPTVAGAGLTWASVYAGTPQFSMFERFMNEHNDGFQVHTQRGSHVYRGWMLTRSTGPWDPMTETFLGFEILGAMGFHYGDYRLGLAVAPQYRRMGLASKMLRYFCMMDTPNPTLRVSGLNVAGMNFALAQSGRATQGSRGRGYVEYLVDTSRFGQDWNCTCRPCLRHLLFEAPPVPTVER